ERPQATRDEFRHQTPIPPQFEPSCSDDARDPVPRLAEGLQRTAPESLRRGDPVPLDRRFATPPECIWSREEGVATREGDDTPQKTSQGGPVTFKPLLLDPGNLGLY